MRSMRPLVLKFGGSSLGTPGRVAAVVELLREASRRGPVVAVASAFGGVTDQLIDLCERAKRRDASTRESLATLVERHRAALLALAPGDREAATAVEEELDQIAEALEGVAQLRSLPAPVHDAVVSAGERLAVAVLSGALRAASLPGASVDAGDLIATGPEHGEAEVDLAVTRGRVRAHLVSRFASSLPIVPGFYGRGSDGAVRLLGRGASDLTATVLGAALGAARVEIWTDVDGVLSADPRLVPEAFTLPRLSPETAGELAFFGAKVLHPRALAPAAAAGVPVVVANTLRPAGGCTWIVAGASEPGVVALAALAGVGRLRVEGAEGSPTALTARVTTALASARVPALLLQSAAARPVVSVAIPWAGAERVRAALAPLRVDARNALALLAVVGEPAGASGVLGAGARAALGREGLRPLAWSEGESGTVVALLEEADLTRAARRLHAEVVVGRESAAGEVAA